MLVCARSTYGIVNGPSKYDLFGKLFEIGGTRTEVLFKINGIPQLDIGLELEGIIAEDGSGNLWIVHGCAKVNHPEYSEDRYAFEGHYNSNTRLGEAHLTRLS